jgi:NAD(P)-dependent dehydrogenase (short-subunit alcohol dehydrogenase family)
MPASDADARRFAGRVALVPGGTSGIGLATAQRFVTEGARVVIAGRRQDAGERALASLREVGGDARFVRADIGSAADVERMVRSAVDEFGQLDIACNTAATDEGGLAFIADTAEADFDRQLTVNLKGMWLCLKYEIRQMLAGGRGGSIVNVSSVNGLGGTPGAAGYSAAKHGVIGLTKTAALEYASAGIRVNALCAGAFRTPMLERAMKRVGGGDIAAAEERYHSMIPLNRIGRPEEAAEVILWLASDAASYVTGHTMIADGGVTAPFR